VAGEVAALGQVIEVRGGGAVTDGRDRDAERFGQLDDLVNGALGHAPPATRRRSGSPSGLSILTTSAPPSASIRVQ
jgi:hypothetical protein